jgi:putative hydrolase of the HAD superfamily
VVPPVALLLDLYDTLVRSDWEEMRDVMAARLGIDARALHDAFDATRPARSVGRYDDVEGDMASIIEATGLQADPELARDLASLEFEFMRDHVRLHDDAMPVIRECRSRGVRTVLVSNCSHSTRAVVDRLGLTDELDAMVLSYEVRSRKPQPEIYLAALQRAGDIMPEDAVFVDDQRRYCDGAAALGIDTRLIIRPGEVPMEGAATSANGHRIIENLRDLLSDWLGD